VAQAAVQTVAVVVLDVAAQDANKVLCDRCRALPQAGPIGGQYAAQGRADHAADA
jgi:hypothetical protein